MIELGTGKPIQRAQKLPKMAKVLVSALSLFTRVQHDGFSHYNASLGHLNTIDHAYINSPGWAQLPWRLSAEVGRPEILFDKGITDHSEVVACLHFDNAPATELLIPGWVAKSPKFKARIQAFIDHSDLDSLLPEHALAAYKEYLREAGRLTRNELNDTFRSSEKQLLPNLILIYRIISSNNIVLASKLIAEHCFFPQRIRIENCLVLLIDPPSFSEEFQNNKSSKLQNLISRESANKKPNMSRIEAATRLS